MACPSNAQYLQIDTTVVFYFFLIVFAELRNLLSWKLPIRNVDILWGDVHMVEQVLPHVVIVTLLVIFGYGIVLI